MRRVLGRALATLLSERGGRLSVVLPPSLRAEAQDLVWRSNERRPRSALLVVDSGGTDPSAGVISEAELLAWRTDDDRVFVLLGDSIEPDTSFASAVTPYITAAFPGPTGGTAHLPEIARACIDEAVGEATASNEVREALWATGMWAAEGLEAALAASPPPEGRWNWKLLQLLATVMEDLADQIDAATQRGVRSLRPQDAWEVARLAGLPLPSKAFPNWSEGMEELGGAQAADVMRNLVERLPEADVLRDELSRVRPLTPGPTAVSAWNGLDWEAATNFARDRRTVPETARRLQGLGGTDPAPSLIGQDSPPPDGPRAWWGVNAKDLSRALQRLDREPEVSWIVPAGVPLRDIGKIGGKRTLLLETRAGSVLPGGRGGRARTRLLVDGPALVVSGDGQRVRIEGEDCRDGDLVIRHCSVSIKPGTGVSPSEATPVRKASGDLFIEFSVQVTFSNSRDKDAAWRLQRKLEVRLEVEEFQTARSLALRTLTGTFSFLVPSPYGHTLACVPSVGKPALFPAPTTRFKHDGEGSLVWAPTGGTPDIVLSEPSVATVWGYDGRWDPAASGFAVPTRMSIDGLPLESGSSEGWGRLSDVRLDSDVTVTANLGNGPTDIAGVKIGDPPKVPVNILQRRRGQIRPRTGNRAWARGFGEYQRALMAPDATAGGGTLYQMVVPSGPGVPFVPTTFERLPSADPMLPGPWPGIGEGPSLALSASEEWLEFNIAAQRILDLSLRRGGNALLSEANFDALATGDVAAYVRAHSALINVASDNIDKFWASFPFSVFVVSGKREDGPSYRHLQAIFLSPFHPARLAWLHATLLHRDACESAGADALVPLLGFASGWDIPAMAEVPLRARGTRSFFAQPLDPGSEGEYAHWSALVATTDQGSLKLPALAAGWGLPWGGRTGLDDAAVHRALAEYLDAHPHATSLVVELRSALEAPRSPQVDRAVLARVAEAAQVIGGTALVVDSPRRNGPPPERDDYLRCDVELEHPAFAWRVQEIEDGEHVDIAFIENAAPELRALESQYECPTPRLPIRRYPIVAGGHDSVDLDYRPAGDDDLGLAGLLRRIEPERGAKLRIVPGPESLVTRSGVRWEVVGDINIDPTQMAEVVQMANGEGGPRFLWEWRPGWLASASSASEAGHGSHYIVARVPNSLVSAFRTEVGLTEPRAEEVLQDLGARGVGLLALRGKRDLAFAAASAFYASRLLVGPPGLGTPNPQAPRVALPPAWFGMDRQILVGLLSMGTASEALAAVAGSTEGLEADLVLFVAFLTEGVVRIHPVMASNGTTTSAKGASEAAAAIIAMVAHLVEPATAPGAAMRNSLRAQALATLIDFAFRAVPANAPHEAERAQVISGLLAGTTRIEAGHALAFSFNGIGRSVEGLAIASPPPGERVLRVTCDPCQIEALIWPGAQPDERQVRLRADLDRALLGAAPPRLSGPSRRHVPPGLGGATEVTSLFPTGPSPTPPPTSPLPTDGHSTPVAQGQEQGASDAVVQAGGPKDPTVDLSVGEVLAQKGMLEEPQAAPELPVDVGRLESPSLEFLGAESSARYTVVGKRVQDGQRVALDLDQPKAIGVFGYMGSGKSYLVGALLEATVEPLLGLGSLSRPLAAIVFNYRRNAADRFELASLTSPNDAPAELEALRQEYQALPKGLTDVHVLCLPGELQHRTSDYDGVSAQEIAFRPSSLDVEDWELLMGEPGSDAVFARATRAALQDLRRQGHIDVPRLRDILRTRLPRNSFAAAELRLDFIEGLVSEAGGSEIADVVRPGRVTVIDLRQPMFNQRDAMKLILVCANQLAKIQGSFNKMIVFDEAHEYMTEEFGQRFDARIRYMRHEGTTYVFATQDVGSIPAAIRRHLGTQFVFSLETQDNIEDMIRFAPQFRNLKLSHLSAGTCYVSSNLSTGNRFAAPRLIRVRPRASSHGGRSRIDSTG